MHPLLKRILTNSVIAASLLAVMGFGLTELARMWLIAQAPARIDLNAPAPDANADVVSYRIPLMMAAWGVGFVVLGELFLWFVLKRRPKPPAPPVVAPPGPDPAEQLLEQLLREAEAKQAAASTPSEPVPENTRITPTFG